MLNWYRALGRRMLQPIAAQTIPVETLLIWGKQDRYLSFEMASWSAALCGKVRLVTFDDASHWVQHDKAAEVSALLVDHFSMQD